MKKKNLTISEMVMLFGTTIRPVTTQGSGRYAQNYRSSKSDNEIKELTATGLFNIETGNDAPRGGATGEFVKFTPKVKHHKAIKAYKIRVAADVAELERVTAETSAKQAADRVIQTTNAIEWLNNGGIAKMVDYIVNRTSGNSHQRGCNAAFHYANRANSSVSVLRNEFERLNGRVYERNNEASQISLQNRGL